MEQGESIIILNSNRLAFESFQRGMVGAAKQAGITSEQDVIDLVNDVRRDMWEKQHDNHV